MGLVLEASNRLYANDYDVIFNCIYDEYLEYCTAWDQIREIEINIKRKYICDIYNCENQLNENFKKYMYSFRGELNNLYISILVKLQEKLNLMERVKFTGRVKTEDSILNKIYKKNNEAQGKFPINSCINDLLGLRIVDVNYKDNIKNIIELLDGLKKKDYNLRYMDRLNNGYKAYHIYFKRDNKSFPIELQIWDKENELENINLHKEYKQNYVENIITNYNNL
jgi:Uncharacterized protein conserved in bacteria